MKVTLSNDRGGRTLTTSPSPEFDDFLFLYERAARRFFGENLRIHVFIGDPENGEVIVFSVMDHPGLIWNTGVGLKIEPADAVVIYPGDQSVLSMKEHEIEICALWDMAGFLSHRVNGAFAQDKFQISQHLGQIAAACLLVRLTSTADAVTHDWLEQIMEWGLAKLMTSCNVDPQSTSLDAFFLMHPQIEVMVDRIAEASFGINFERRPRHQEVCKLIIEIVSEAIGAGAKSMMRLAG